MMKRLLFSASRDEVTPFSFSSRRHNIQPPTPPPFLSLVLLSFWTVFAVLVVLVVCRKGGFFGGRFGIVFLVGFLFFLFFYHPLRLLEGEALAAVELMIHPNATSAASSLALLRFFPSYQNRAARICPLIVTRLDQAVRPPLGGRRKKQG